MTMNHPLQTQHQALRSRQQTLDFEQTDRWQQLSEMDQQACCEALAELLKTSFAQLQLQRP